MVCHEALGRHESNVMILQCGHKMHLMPIPKRCCGGFTWIVQNDTCPMCRQSPCDTGGKSKKTLPPRLNAAVVVDLETLEERA
jgi:hypothetical protein